MNTTATQRQSMTGYERGEERSHQLLHKHSTRQLLADLALADTLTGPTAGLIHAWLCAEIDSRLTSEQDARVLQLVDQSDAATPMVSIYRAVLGG